MKKRLFLIVICVVTVSALIFTVIHIRSVLKNNKEKITELTQNIVDLEDEIRSYGNPVSVFTVSEDILSGNVFDRTKITEMPTVDTLITDKYVTNLDDIENYIYKINATVGIPLTYDIFTQEIIGNTDRYYDVVADSFPIEPRVGQYYDLRMVTPKGIDYIVLSKKRVHSFYGEAIRLVLNEEEIHQYQSALVDCFLNPGTFLYVDVYVEPAMQKKATVYYPPSEEVLAAMALDPNIVMMAQDAILISNRKLFEQGLGMSEEASSAVTSGRSNILNKIAQAKAQYKSADSIDYEEDNKFTGTSTIGSVAEDNSSSNSTENAGSSEHLTDDKKQVYENAANFLNDDGA